MEPVSSLFIGVTGNFLSAGLESGYRTLSADDFCDCYETAAAQTAVDYERDAPKLKAANFDALFYADLPTKDLATFEQKVDATSRHDFATRLQTATEADLDKPEQVVDAFFRNVEGALAVAQPEKWRQFLLEYAHEFIDSQERREEFETVLKTEVRQLHEDTQAYVTEEHQRTRAQIETVIQDVHADSPANEQANSLPQGFQRLSTLDFEATREVTRCWRIGFDFANIRAGHAFERQGKTDASTTVVDELREKLLDGEDVVVLGRAGSGKSTTCKQVACRWHTRDDGPVFYYESSKETPLIGTDGLTAAIEAADDDCLVVVEDAIRPNANDVFDVLDSYWGNESVHFLLDARIEDWRNGDDLLDADATEARDLWQHELTEYPLPALTIDECEAVVEHFENNTGKSVREPVDRIHEQLQQTSGTGEMLLLGYYLARQTTGDQPPTQPLMTDTVNPLETDVRTTYDWLRDQDSDDGSNMALRVGVLVALLKASRLGVHAELIYALGNSVNEYEEIERTLEVCTGQLVFEENGDYETHHELWATLFLEHMLKQLGSRHAATTFETCVNALFSLFDKRSKRDDIQAWSRGELTFPDSMADEKQSFVDSFVTAIFDLGTRRPKLAPLFGPTEYSQLDLPDACSAGTVITQVNKCGAMYLIRSDYERAESEFSNIEHITQGIDEFDDSDIKQSGAMSLGNLGLVARAQGEYEKAREYHEDSLELHRELDAVTQALEAYKNCVETTHRLGDTAQTLKYCEIALELLEQSDTSGADEFADWFHRRYADLQLVCDENPNATRRLYRRVLDYVIDDEGPIAGLLFRDLWDRRETVEQNSETCELVLSAGVGFAAHFTIFNEEYPNYEQEDVLATVKSHWTRLSPPARALYDSLAESSTDPDFEVFDEDIDTESDEQSLRDLEIQAYETFLSLLVAVKIDLVDK